MELSITTEKILHKPESGTCVDHNPISPEDSSTLAPFFNSSSNLSEQKYFTLADAFPNAAAFLMFFDTSLREGSKMLYSWQIEELIRLSNISEWKIDKKLQYYLLANNGSGKDAFIIAGLVVYVLCCVRRYKVVITSSSDNQLDTQTRIYIKDLATSVNTYMRTVWGWETNAIDIKSESLKAAAGFTGTEVYTFVSKEGSKVEGYHPFPDAPAKEGVIIIINEGKSIPEEIHFHLKKCTYNIWIEVSSAGEAAGSFYKAISDSDKYPSKPRPFKAWCRTITYLDTPHKMDEAAIAISELGLEHPFVKNTYLSKFSSIGQQVCITEDSLNRCITEGTGKKIKIGAGKHGGIDFAAGGDECCFYVFDENTLIGYQSWRVKDTEDTIDILIGTKDGIVQGLFQKFGIVQADASKFTGDDNGLGEPIINSLHKQGWKISRIKNQQSARRKDRYLNRGAELYGSFARLVEKGYINWNNLCHTKLHRQLVTRHYTIEGQAKYKLVPKEDEVESPDHADAIVLAWSQWSILDFQTDEIKIEKPRTPSPMLTTSEIAKVMFRNNMKWQLDGIIQNEKVLPKKFKSPITVLRSIYN